MLPSYFWNGCQHFLFALGCTFALRNLLGVNFLKSVPFLLALILGSSALFFLPTHIAAHSSWLDYLYQFSHYPLPDWDILLIGMRWHRFFLSRSLIVPLLLLLSTRRMRLPP